MTDPLEQRMRAAAYEEGQAVRPPVLAELRGRSRRRLTTAVGAPVAVAGIVVAGLLGINAVVGHGEPRPDPVAAPPRASVVQDGVRLTLAVDRSTVRIGQVATATVTVKNTTDHPVSYTGDGCFDLAPTLIRVQQQTTPGRQWTGDDARFKAAAVPSRIAVADVVPAGRFDVKNAYCTEGLRGDAIPAGETRRQQLFWRAAMPEGGRPAGPATMVSTFHLGEASAITRPAARPEVSVALTVEAAGRSRLSQPEAVDAALADPAFQRWLRADTSPGTRPFAFYDRAEQRWTVGRSRKTPAPGSGYVVIDAVTGDVVSRSLG